MKTVVATESFATFSPCERYRYVLARTWLFGTGTLCFLLLNPSTATAHVNDPTVERCQRRAVMLGYKELIVCNLFALRSTDPRLLKQVADPVGPDNDDAILAAAQASDLVICGWGRRGSYLGRDKAVVDLLSWHRVTLHCLAQLADGTPQHPLYLRYDLKPLLLALPGFADPASQTRAWPLKGEAHVTRP